MYGFLVFCGGLSVRDTISMLVLMMPMQPIRKSSAGGGVAKIILILDMITDRMRSLSTDIVGDRCQTRQMLLLRDIDIILAVAVVSLLAIAGTVSSYLLDCCDICGKVTF